MFACKLRNIISFVYVIFHVLPKDYRDKIILKYVEVNKIMQRQTEICHKYQAFGWCNFGDNCNYKHKGVDVYDNEYFTATITDGTGLQFGGMVTVSKESGHEENFNIGNTKWAKKGDVVKFQASSKRYRGQCMGRVVNIVQDHGHEAPMLEVFTIDSPGTKIFDDAISIENCCPKHENCKRIGIHISETDLQYSGLDVSKIPCYGSGYHDLRKFSLDRGKTAKVISVFIHTHAAADGPVRTVVTVRDNYHYDSDFQNVEIDCLEQKFVDPSDFDKKRQKYIRLYPNSYWKIRYLIDKIMIEFRQAVAKYDMSLYFIARPRSDQNFNDRKKTLVAFKDLHEGAMSQFSSTSCDNLEKVLAFVAGANTSRHRFNSRDVLFPPKYERDVLAFTTNDKNGASCTSPLTRFVDYVNQQILLNRIIGNETPIYSREDLMGMLVIRFRSPFLIYVKVVEIKTTSSYLQYIDPPENIPSSMCEIANRVFADAPKIVDGKITATYVVSCEKEKDYCNRNIAHIDEEEFQVFLDSLQSPVEPNKKSFPHLVKSTEVSPYHKEVTGTELTLQPGVQLQLQISPTDGRDKNGRGFRLLRIGKNCHICLTHIHNPEIAFMSDRKDVRDLMSSSELINMKEATLEEKLSEPIRIDRIDWQRYYASGSFTNSKSESGKFSFKDLVCIRKETNVDGEGVGYVWCCHGVISKLHTDGDREVVGFQVCTLMQTDRHTEGHGFLVEIARKANHVK